jgi:hypothetical protein
MSHAPCSKALKPLEILIRAVVTIVVSRAEMNKQSQSAAMIVCSLALLILGTTVAAAAAVELPPAVVFSSSAIRLRVQQSYSSSSPHSSVLSISGVFLHVSPSLAQRRRMNSEMTKQCKSDQREHNED